jgi:hypothetical protein
MCAMSQSKCIDKILISDKEPENNGMCASKQPVTNLQRV